MIEKSATVAKKFYDEMDADEVEDSDEESDEETDEENDEEENEKGFLDASEIPGGIGDDFMLDAVLEDSDSKPQMASL